MGLADVLGPYSGTWPLIYLQLSILIGYITYNRFFHPLAKVPGPFFASISPLWLTCQGWKAQRQRLEPALHRKYGSVVRIAPGEVIFSNPEHFNTVFGAGASKRFKKGRFYEALTDGSQPPGPDRLDMLTEWDQDRLNHQKRLVGPVYSVKNTLRHEELIDNNLVRWMTRLDRLAGKPLDLTHEIELLVIDVQTEITFAQPFGAVDAGSDGEHMATMSKMWHHWAWIGHLPWLNALDKKFSSFAFKFMDPGALKLPVFPFCVQRMMAYAEQAKAGTASPCLLRDLRELSKAKPEMRENWANNMSLTNLGAGVDTQSWTLATVVGGVCKDKRTYAKLQREIEDAVQRGDIVKGVPVTYEAASRLPYLQACMNEATRLWPNLGVSLPRRVPAEGISLDGYFVPGGYTVGMNCKQLGLSEEVYGPETSSFVPERWLEASKEQRHEMDTKSLAFGGPSRKCPGMHLAWTNMTKILATLFVNYEVKILNELDGKPGPGGAVWTENGAFITQWKGCEMAVTRR